MSEDMLKRRSAEIVIGLLRADPTKKYTMLQLRDKTGLSHHTIKEILEALGREGLTIPPGRGRGLKFYQWNADF